MAFSAEKPLKHLCSSCTVLALHCCTLAFSPSTWAAALLSLLTPALCAMPFLEGGEEGGGKRREKERRKEGRGMGGRGQGGLHSLYHASPVLQLPTPHSHLWPCARQQTLKKVTGRQEALSRLKIRKRRYKRVPLPRAPAHSARATFTRAFSNTAACSRASFALR